MNDLFGRLANCRNQNQGTFTRVLCLCSAGLLRSPTIAWVLSNEPYNCNTRAAGVSDEYALIPVDQVLLTWAEIVVCASDEPYEKAKELLKKFKLENTRPIYKLNVPDSYMTRDPNLVKLIKEELDRVSFNCKL